ncbi:hypothetical protein [Saccharomonospora sp. NB11]|uniref:hypothetical protein n=1 Tax=Saccharomonospora sp. NB11 TaxID=1642298 RepID=UPI0018D15DCE|nr:hypothetical protein [Saccharomonospora sp. NB11]
MTLPAFAAVPAMNAGVWLAQQQPGGDGGDGGGQGEDFGKSSPVGLLLLLVFFIAVAFLVRSMTKHLKRIPASFDDPSEGTEGAEGTENAAKGGAAERADDGADDATGAATKSTGVEAASGGDSGGKG